MAQIGIEREGFRPSYRPARPATALDPEMRRLGLIAAAIGGGIALLVAGGTLMAPRHHGVPIIEAAEGPVRIKPENAGGMQVTGADIGLGAGSAPVLAPAAEQPQINALKAQLHAVKKELARQAAETEQAAKLAQVAKAEASAKVVAAPPVQRASATARLAVPQTAIAFAPAAKPALAASPAPTASRIDRTSVQLAAFADEAAAKTAWAALMKKQPDLLGGREPEIVQAKIAGRTRWRLRTGGFGTMAEAAGFCTRMRARGADCAVAAF